MRSIERRDTCSNGTEQPVLDYAHVMTPIIQLRRLTLLVSVRPCLSRRLGSLIGTRCLVSRQNGCRHERAKRIDEPASSLMIVQVI